MQKRVLKFVVGTNQSLSIVDNPLFHDLLPAEFVAPSRKYFTNVCLTTAYENTKEKLLYDITNRSCKYVGIQVDHTTAKNFNPYGNMCLQFVNDDFTVHCVSIGNFEYTDKHNAQALFNSCEGEGGLVDTWGLKDFKRVYTTDSFSGNVKAFKDCETVGWVPCMAHVIHNTVKHGLKNVDTIKSLQTKMRSILHYCHKSPETLALIKGNAKWLGLPDLTLTSECPTRWNSFLDCGERLLKI